MSQRQEAAIKKPTADLRDRHGKSDLRSILPEQIDWKPFAAFPPSARLAVLVGHWAKSGEYTTQVSAMGPLGLEYVRSKDDPRNQSSDLQS